jgi:hypothetical protein
MFIFVKNKNMVANMIIKLSIQSIIKKYPNNGDLGSKFRKEKINFYDFIDDDIFKKYPNDYDLGKEVREIYS